MESKKKNPQRMNTVLYTIVEQIKNISILLNPIIPISTKKVLETINISDTDILIENINKENLLDNDKELRNLEILFKKIENDN
jgi:methionyl-tRNA synthetase